MVSLSTVGEHFSVDFKVIEGGSGVVSGILTETDQASQPSYVFVAPRHVFRARYPTALQSGMVIQSPLGTVFIVGDNGPSETWKGTLWQSFRLFQPTGRYRWERRVTTTDPITRLAFDTGETQLLGNVWAALEAIDREQTDRDMRINFEQIRIITGAPVKINDLLDNHAITKLDKQLGLSIGVLT